MKELEELLYDYDREHLVKDNFTSDEFFTSIDKGLEFLLDESS